MGRKPLGQESCKHPFQQLVHEFRGQAGQVVEKPYFFRFRQIAGGNLIDVRSPVVVGIGGLKVGLV
jgi:hypothetical protein